MKKIYILGLVLLNLTMGYLFAAVQTIDLIKSNTIIELSDKSYKCSPYHKNAVTLDLSNGSYIYFNKGE